MADIIDACAPVAQLDRAFACGAKGRVFESPQAHSGGVPEWPNGLVSKTSIAATLSGVRILSPPQKNSTACHLLPDNNKMCCGYKNIIPFFCSCYLFERYSLHHSAIEHAKFSFDCR